MNMKRILQCTATVFILLSGSLLYNFINPTDTTAFICQADKRDMQQIDIEKIIEVKSAGYFSNHSQFFKKVILKLLNTVLHIQ